MEFKQVVRVDAVLTHVDIQTAIAQYLKSVFGMAVRPGDVDLSQVDGNICARVHAEGEQAPKKAPRGRRKKPAARTAGGA